MSLTKHGRFYWLDIRIRGRRYRRSLRTTNRNEALDKYKDIKDELLERYSGNKIRFSDFCKKYLDWSWSARPKSALKEQWRLKKTQAFFDSLGLIYLDDITPYHLDQFKAHLRQTKRSPKSQETLTKTTINFYLQLLRFMFNRAIDWEIYKKPNPLKKVRFFKHESLVKTVSDRDVDKIMEEAKRIKEKPRSPLQAVFHDMIIIAINTGMRRSEVLGLKWRDIKEDTIEVMGKGEKRRVIPINKKVMAILQDYPERSPYIFDVPNRNKSNTLFKTVRTIKKRTGVDFCFHSFRHYFSSLLMKKGVDIVTIASLLGHSKISVSLMYTHADEDMKKKAVDLLVNE